MIVGRGLVQSSRKLAGELFANVQKETLAEVAAQRRSSLVLLLNNVLTDLSKEIEK